jgi:hypothetical protein
VLGEPRGGAVAAGGCPGRALAAQAQTTLRIRGSDTLGAKLVPSLAEGFKKMAGSPFVK